jgi:hypothetical protein
MEPDIVQAVAAWSAIARFAERVIVPVFDELYLFAVVAPAPALLPVPPILVYFTTGCVMVWDSDGVFAAMVCWWVCCGIT